MFSRWPLLRSSATRTTAPRATRPSTRCDPMNDAPPVTSTGRPFQFMSRLSLGLALARRACHCTQCHGSLARAGPLFLDGALVERLVRLGARLPAVLLLDAGASRAGTALGL